MKEDINEINRAIEAYEELGYVTKKQVKSMDLYSFSNRVFKALEKRGYQNVLAQEIRNNMDYSSIIYNHDIMSVDEAKEYMLNFVLEKY